MRRFALLVAFAACVFETVSATTACTNQTVALCTLPHSDPIRANMSALNKCCSAVPTYGKCLEAIPCTSADSGYEAWRAAIGTFDGLTYACTPEAKKVYFENQECFFQHINQTVADCVANTKYENNLCTYLNALVECQYKELAEKCNDAIAKVYGTTFAKGLTPYLPAGCTIQPPGGED